VSREIIRVCSYCSQGALVKIQPIDIARFYLAVRKEAAAGGLFDGAGHRVHYNMRVLVRALKLVILFVFTLHLAAQHASFTTTVHVFVSTVSPLASGILQPPQRCAIHRAAAFMTGC
jgi:hypothetical protein